MKKIIVDKESGKVKVLSVITEKSRTQQQFKDMVNINNIMKQYSKTKELKHLNMRQGQYADLTQIKDYKESLETVITAQKAFETVPAHIRAEFQNDPHQFINFLQDSKNDQRAIELGLKEKIQNEQPKQSDQHIPISDANNISNTSNPK